MRRRTTYRRRVARWVVPVLGTPVSLVPLAAATAAEAPWPVFLVAYVLTGCWVTALWRTFGAMVRLSPDGVLVRNLWRAWRIPWSEVRGVTLVERSVWLVLRGGRGLKLDAVPRSRLADLHRDVSLHLGMPPPDTQ